METQPEAGRTIDGRRVEVKTISPEKFGNLVFVKRLGDFEQLLILRVDKKFAFARKLFDRNEFAGGGGRFLRARLREGNDQI